MGQPRLAMLDLSPAVAPTGGWGGGEAVTRFHAFMDRYGGQIFLGLIVAALVVLIVAGLLIHVSPEEQQAQMEAREKQAAETVQRGKRIIELCRIMLACAPFEKARQECATAGDFGLCVDVKMGKQDYRPPSMCTQAPPADMPAPSVCWVRHNIFFE
jgi:hypothetical protein